MSSLGIFDKKTKTYKKIAGLAEAAAVDDTLSPTSTNPVQNKVVKDALDHKLKGYTITYTVRANTGGWHKIAQATGGYFNFDLYVTGGWSNQPKSNAHFQIQNTNGNVRIVQLSGLRLLHTNNGISKLRMIRVSDDKDIWILEEYSISSINSEIFRFTIAGNVTVTPLDGSVDTTTDFKGYVSLDVSDIPTGTVITTGNIDSHLTDLKYGEVAGGKNLFKKYDHYGSYKVATETYNGNSVIYSSSNWDGAWQTDLILKKGKTYTISAYVKGSGRYNVLARKTENNAVVYLDEEPLNSEWTKIACVFTLDFDVHHISLEVYNGSLYISCFQIEEGTQATEYEPYIPSVKMLEEEKADKSETTVNLLNSTFDTETHNGVTFTRNDDGTYSLSGSRTDTSISAYTSFIDNLPLEKGKYKLTGALDENNYIRCIIKVPDSANRNIYDYGDGAVLDVNETDTTITLLIISTDDTSKTRIIKPMLTTNLSATYYDFVPYTGDTGRLNGDVAELKAEVTNNKTVVDAAMSDTSTNPVQNKVVKKYVDDHAPNITVDDALSPTSTNPVQNKVVTNNLTDLKKETTVNLLNPTLETTTKDGITCTNNGDGTYTLNGTVKATSNRAVIVIQYCGDTIGRHLNKNLLLTGCPKHDESIDMNLHLDAGISHASDSGNGSIFKFSQVAGRIPIKIEIGTNGTTVNNLVFKPMITTNLNATYDDFVPYTGDTGKLNSDVAGLAKKIPKFERNGSIFESGIDPQVYGPNGSPISSHYEDTDNGRELHYKFPKTGDYSDCMLILDIPAHTVVLCQFYSNKGVVSIYDSLFFYNKNDTSIKRSVGCRITGANADDDIVVTCNLIVIKNV